MFALAAALSREDDAHAPLTAQTDRVADYGASSCRWPITGTLDAPPGVEAAMCKILVVDDDAELRDALQATLAAHGHVVFCAEDGIAELRAAVEIKPELIISDVDMPLLEGPDA
ncbi:response regulator transcription factor, partial [Paraburkholderia mimosarum]|uniref:response regulator transcription factor n=1 Tax=Paraburkholderia mimosarum TaxID=312026 RepID=UPI0039C4CC3E